MTADDLDIDDIQRTLLCNADIPCGRLTMGAVWHDIKALALVAEVRRLRAESAHRFLVIDHGAVSPGWVQVTWRTPVLAANRDEARRIAQVWGRQNREDLRSNHRVEVIDLEADR